MKIKQAKRIQGRLLFRGNWIFFLLTLLVAWHLIGVLLYFLLGHDTRSPSAYRYAFWTFFTYRLGDLPLVLAAGVLYHTYGTWSLPALFEQIADAAGADPDKHLDKV